MSSNPIQAPAGYVSSHAAAFAASDGTAVVVSDSTPLPVTAQLPTATAPIAGTTSASLQSAPFTPVLGRPVMLALSGTWSGQVRVLRSADSGLSRLPLSIGGGAWGQFTANACEAVWEEGELGAQLYLDIVLSSGTLTYRMAQ
jgi:hypothetical protein